MRWGVKGIGKDRREVKEKGLGGVSAWLLTMLVRHAGLGGGVGRQAG
jgi:hypothetical protein